MKADDLKLVINNVLSTEDGYKFIKHLIEESGCLDKSINFDTLREYYIRGKKDFGNYLLELIRVNSFKNFIKIQEERMD